MLFDHYSKQPRSKANHELQGETDKANEWRGNHRVHARTVADGGNFSGPPRVSCDPPEPGEATPETIALTVPLIGGTRAAGVLWV